MDPTSGPAPRPRRRFLLPAAIALVSFLAFLPSLKGEFLNWDDDYNYLANPHYRGLGPANLRWMFTHAYGHYMPLTWITLGLDYTLWGMDPRGYHATNMALHALNALLFYFVLQALLRRARPEADHSTVDWAAAAGALFFSLHPLRVESVAWITERRDVLSGAFFLFTLLAYLRRVEQPEQSPARWKWLALSALSFAGMLLSKTMGLTLPLVLLAIDVYPLRRLSRGTVRSVLLEKLPYAALMIGAFVLLSFTAGQADGITSREHYSLLNSLLQPGFRVGFYLWKTLMPVDLSPFYFYRPGIGAPQIIGTVVLAGISLALLFLRNRLPALLAAWIAYGLLIAPASGVVQFGSIFAADRYTYLACLPFAALVSGGLLLLPRRHLPLALGATGALVIGLALLTVRQSRIWENSVALWTRAIDLDPDVYYSRHCRGKAYAARGDWDRALADYDRAVELNPNWDETRLGRARARVVKGDLAGAFQDAADAVRLNPKSGEAWFLGGLVQARRKRADLAIPAYSRALELRPGYVEARVERAIERRKIGDLAGALADLDAAIEVDPHPRILSLRGVTRAITQDLRGAVADFERALERAPADWPQRAEVEQHLRQARSELPK